MAELYIYSSLNLREARGNLEDDLADFLGTTGEVTGGGGGLRGWNIDLEVSDAALAGLPERLTNFLTEWGVPPDTYFEVWQVRNGNEQSTRYDVFATSDIVDWINTTLAFLADRLATDPSTWQTVKDGLEAKVAELLGAHWVGSECVPCENPKRECLPSRCPQQPSTQQSIGPTGGVS